MLYLDDDSVHSVLVRLLQNAGHDLRIPANLGLTGREDPVHFRFAIRENRVLLTSNYKDFHWLHELILEAKGHHPGIFVVRKDNNPKRDLTSVGIVRAIAKLETANQPIIDQYTVLNQWR